MKLGILLLTLALLPIAASASTVEESACMATVQSFYDWYIATDANVRTVVTAKADAITPYLLSLLRQHIAFNEQLDGYISDLNFDPFLNAQDIDGKYAVSHTHVIGRECLATVAARQTRLSVVLEETPGSSHRFLITDAIYPSDRLAPERHLIVLLRRDLAKGNKRKGR